MAAADATFAGQRAIVIAGAGRLKLILYAVPWALMGLPLLICGPWMAVTEAFATGDRVSVAVGCGMAAAGWLLTGFMACRLRAAFDPRIQCIAGPAGTHIAFPSAPSPRRLFMTYRIKTYDIRADEIEKVYARVSKVNGIPITSEAVIVGGNWNLKVDAMFFEESAETLVASLRAALGGWKQP